MHIISSREQITDLIEEYIDTQNEWQELFWTDNVVEWDGKRQALYGNGVVLGKFREKDILTMQTLKRGVTDSALKEEILDFYQNEVKELESVESPTFMHIVSLERSRKRRDALLVDSVDMWILKNCDWANDEKEQVEYSQFRVLIYLYYMLKNINIQRNHPCCTDMEYLKSIYRNVFNKKSQFYKYGLLPVDGERELMIIDPPRIYDKNINKTLFLKNIPKKLLEQIDILMKEGLIGQFLVRTSNYCIYDGKTDYQECSEAVEKGTVFDFSNLGTYSVTKLYSEKYENCLWINIDSENITFEELCEDFEIYEDYIITQVIHMEYVVDIGEAFITHLDHEYIFYTVEEYEKRCKDIKQKGEGYPRFKSFKIDNAKIPFFKRCLIENKDEKGNIALKGSEQFLCYVLESYFMHKDLLKEYFQLIKEKGDNDNV